MIRKPVFQFCFFLQFPEFATKFGADVFAVHESEEIL